MSSQAYVQSLEAVEAVRAALVIFLDQVGQALATLDTEMRRMLEWLEHDRPGYWRRQIRQAVDDVTEAQAALHRCLMYPINDERPACREERAMLQQAQEHLAYCRHKAERVRYWAGTVRHEMSEYQGRISRLVQLVDVDGPHAVGVLGRIIRQLEEYQAVRTSQSRAAYEGLALVEDLWRKPSGDDQTSPPPLSGRGAAGEGVLDPRANPATANNQNPPAKPAAPPPPDADSSERGTKPHRGQSGA